MIRLEKRAALSAAIFVALLVPLLVISAYASPGQQATDDVNAVPRLMEAGVEPPGATTQDVAWPELDANGARMAEAPVLAPDELELGRAEGGSSPLVLGAGAAGFGPDELVTQVAEALEFDPLAIYNYVKTEIAFDPVFGLKRSPHLTIQERTGTDADQAALLAELLRAAGFTVTYNFGTVTLPLDLAASWVRVYEDASVFETCSRVFWALNNHGGHPVSTSQPCGNDVTEQFTAPHVWVTADIGGTLYELDPSVKANEQTLAIDLESTLGYSRSAFVTDAVKDATIGANSVQNLNADNIATDLDLYAANLIDYLDNDFIATNGRHAYVREVVGGWEVAEAAVDSLPEVLPYPTAATDTFDSFDAPGAPELRHKVSIEVLDCVDEDSCFFSLYSSPDIPQADVAGHRLTYRFSGSTGTLRLDGADLGSASGALFSQYVEFCFDTPSAGSFGDQCARRWVDAADGNIYAFIVESGRVPESLLAERRAILAENQAAFLPDSEAVIGEALHVLGLSWFNEKGAAERLHEAIANVNGYRFHGMAIMDQSSGFGIDVKINMAAIYSPTFDADDRSTFFTAAVAQGSGIEHAFIEQLQDKKSISTIKVLQIADRDGKEIFLGKPANWFAKVRPLLTYDAATLSSLDNAINNGYSVLVPQSDVTLNAWTGTGWIQFKTGSEGYIIRGGTSGGVCTLPPDQCVVDPDSAADLLHSIGEMLILGALLFGDPVDTQTGAFTLAETDVSLADSRPLSIEDFGRFYNSGAAEVSGPFGPGWRHTYGWTLQRHSAYLRGIEGPKAVEAARLIAQAFVLQDMIRNTVDPEVVTREIQALVIKWGLDQLLDNALVLTGPEGANGTFVRLPGDTFSRSSGLPWDLVENLDGSITLDGRAGEELRFDKVATVPTTEGPQGDPTCGDGIDNDVDGLVDGDDPDCNVSWRLASWQDGNSNTLSLTYDAVGPEGKLTQVTDEVTRTLTFEYTGDLVTKVTDPAGREHGYEYDGNDDLVAYTDPRGMATAGDPNDFVTHYSYTDHRLETITDPETNTFLTSIYDGDGRVDQQTDGRLNNTFFYYGDHLTRVKNPLGDNTVVTWRDDGSLQTTTDEAGFVTNSHFDSSGNLITLEEPESATSTFKYDVLDNLTDSTDPLGNTTHFEYDPDSRTTLIRDPLLHETAFVYDGAGNLTSTTNALLQTTTFQYDPAGRPTDIFEPPDKATGTHAQMTYDAFGNLETTMNAELEKTVFGYEPTIDQLVGQLTNVTDPLFNTTSFEYDAAGNQTKVTDPLGHFTRFEYDGNSLVTKVTDPKTRETVNEYDPMNNLTLITRPDTTTIGFAYDDNNRLTSLTDPRGKVWAVERDPRGLVAAEIDPLTNRREFLYDGLRRLDQRTDAELRVTDYTYDAASRLTDVSYDDATAIHNTYDADGLLDTSSYKAWNADYQYDALHRVTVEDYPYLGRNVEQKWDELGLETSSGDRMKLELKAGPTTKDLVTYEYDDAHRLRVMIDGTGPTNYGYDLTGRLTATALPNGASIEQAYDAASRIMSVINKDGLGDPFAVFEYFDPDPATPLYDEADNVTGVRHTTPQAALPTDYVYDTLDRLIEEQTPRETVTYTYDDAGNRETRADAAGTTNYAYDDANQLLSSGPGDQSVTPGPTFYGYDGNGNLISKTTPAGTTAFEWDHENRLTGITPPAGPAVTFAYDPLGRQILRQEDGGPAVHRTYDGLRLLAEGPANLSLGFVYGGGARRLEHRFDLAGSPDATGYAIDRLGSISNLTGVTGKARDSYRSDAFGGEGLAAGLDDNAFRFGGSFGTAREPAAPGLVRMGFRFYDTDAGRFISRDPIGFLGADTNLYAYVANNPATAVDPYGLAPGKPGGSDNQQNASIWTLLGYAGALAIDQVIFSGLGPCGGILNTCNSGLAPLGSPWYQHVFAWHDRFLTETGYRFWQIANPWVLTAHALALPALVAGRIDVSIIQPVGRFIQALPSLMLPAVQHLFLGPPRFLY